MRLEDRLMRAADEAKALTARLPVTVDEVLKLHRNRAVFRVQTPNGPAIAKRFLGPDAAARVTAAAAEIDYMAPKMTGAYRLARVIEAWPDHGVILQEIAPGTRLTEVLAEAEPTERRTLLAAAGGWLAAYSAPRRAILTFDAGPWLTQARNRATRKDSPDAWAIAAALEKMAELAQTHAQAPLLVASSHGDFVASNLLWHDGVLWGVDIDGETRLPLAKEVARFLVWARMGTGLPPYQDDLRAFAPEQVLQDTGQDGIFDFFTGFEVIMRMMDVAERPHHLPPLRAFLAEWLD